MKKNKLIREQIAEHFGVEPTDEPEVDADDGGAIQIADVIPKIKDEVGK